MASTRVRRRADHQFGSPDASGGTAARAETPAESKGAPATSVADQREPGERSSAYEAGVEEIRRRYGSDVTYLFPRLEDRIRRQFGLAPLGPGAAVLAGLTAVAVRLSVALVVTALAGQWAGIPWGRWAVILAFFGMMDAGRSQTTPPLDVEPKPSYRDELQDWTALLPTITRESDVRDLAAFTRRWFQLSGSVAAGIAAAAVMLLGCWRVAPMGVSELHPGSLALLALLLYEFGEMVHTNLFWWALIRRESTYDHELSWPSPADSPEIRTARQKMPRQSFAFGMWITVLLVVTLVLTSWDSPLVIPLGVGFLVIGYSTVIGVALGDRAALRRIVEHSRNQELDQLQQQIAPYRSRYAQLTPQETEQLRSLLELHTVIQNAPTTASTRTLWRTAAGLLLPTLVFAVTVLAEVSAERFLDTILP